MTLSSLVVRGPYHGPTGYDHHTREFVRELVRQGVAVQLVDVPQWGPMRLPAEMQDPWFDTLKLPVRARTALHFTMPHQVVSHPEMSNVNYTMFEATRIRARWVFCAAQHDLVVVPTESSRRAWLNSGVPDAKIRLCPLGVDAAAFVAPTAPIPMVHISGRAISSFATRFLNVSALGPRKNLPGLLAAWIEATTPDDDAVLILKVRAANRESVKRVIREVRQVETEVGRRTHDAAPIHLVTDFVPDGEMPRVYAAATHYISVSHGEGWDQPMVEAAASGLQLIAPNHSAYTAYLDDSVARLIPSVLEPAAFLDSHGGDKWFRGAQWWSPDRDAARSAIRDAIDGKRSIASAQPAIVTEFTWELATRRLIEVLTELERSKMRRWFPAWRRGNRRSAQA